VRQKLYMMAATVALIMATGRAVADSSALARIVDSECVPNEQVNGKPSPCAAVDLDGRYAILKDLVGASQFLLIASTPEPGIEGTDLEGHSAPNYFEEAWKSRHFMDDKLGRALPRDVVGLAINSIAGRTQNRFHIHIDCVRADVLQQLKADAGSIGTSWTAIPGGLVGHPYRAMRVEAANLSEINPFALLAADLPPGNDRMGDQSLVAIASAMPDGSDGFYLLTDHVGAAPGDMGSGEELLDHRCEVLK
jgi:CDP-diacylglycerol pyrophosphatase